MEIGFIGLGKMGGAMVTRLHAAGHRVVGCDLDPAARARAQEIGIETVETMKAMVEKLTQPRVVWVMAPPGAKTEAVINELKGLLSSGDILVDGGNSDFRDSLRRIKEVEATGITFVDAGVSGGVQGAKNGCGLLVGGSAADFERLKPIFTALAAPGGFSHVGPSGAGHYAKTIHNGVEYAIMQAYGEGYEMLAASEIGVDILAVMEAWQGGCSIRSHLLSKLIEALRPDPTLSDVKGYAADSGMGRWTVEEAIRLRVPTPTITAALQARFRSQQEDSPTIKSIAALRGVIGGHAVQSNKGK